MLGHQNCGLHMHHVRGFSMLEVLITVLVLSFGLLGMAGLIMTGMKSNATAHFRSVAIHQTHDIADRMRANLSGVRNGSYNDLTTNIPASNDCTAAECDADQMAVYDHAQWNVANGNLLPNGQGTVSGDLVNGYVITIMWTEKDRGGGCQGVVSPETRCFLTRFSP
ncbi:type IV pilus modification protein PilV [Nitrosomonas marina]|uniref:Type IV pilus assembly protein PilV n=1 Tax=Nitrosomonas marina TaxID=917 RepID=A0A1H8CQ85_9PROT|nr:type IV pilus modification protein PilV [Nitrosomonas marina]SEM96614.1 type IV pilus assembly protein PilV [Nitrosomonas marina]